MASDANNTALVSAIIPVYNRGAMAIEAIESALAQTYQNLEVIVVDDGSTDDSLQLLQKYSTNPRVKIIHQENKGVSAARNLGIKESQGLYIAMLDSDDIWLPNKTERQLPVLQGLNIGLVYSERNHVTLKNGKWVPSIESRNKNRHHGRIFEKVIEETFIRLSTVIIPRYVLEDTGLFCEELKTSEDRHLFARIAHKYIIEYVSEPLALVRRHSQNLSFNPEIEPATLTFLRKIEQEFPECSGRWFKKAYAQNARSSATDAFYDRRMKQARREFWEASKYRPEVITNWLWLAATLIPVPLLNGMRKLRHGNEND